MSSKSDILGSNFGPDGHHLPCGIPGAHLPCGIPGAAVGTYSGGNFAVRLAALAFRYRWTLPEIIVRVPPPIQIAPSASAVTWTRPRRPSAVPWLAV